MADILDAAQTNTGASTSTPSDMSSPPPSVPYPEHASTTTLAEPPAEPAPEPMLSAPPSPLSEVVPPPVAEPTTPVISDTNAPASPVEEAIATTVEDSLIVPPPAPEPEPTPSPEPAVSEAAVTPTEQPPVESVEEPKIENNDQKHDTVKKKSNLKILLAGLVVLLISLPLVGYAIQKGTELPPRASGGQCGGYCLTKCSNKGMVGIGGSCSGGKVCCDYAAPPPPSGGGGSTGSWGVCCPKTAADAITCNGASENACGINSAHCDSKKGATSCGTAPPPGTGGSCPTVGARECDTTVGKLRVCGADKTWTVTSTTCGDTTPQSTSTLGQPCTTTGAMGECYNGFLLTCNPLSRTWMSSAQVCGPGSDQLGKACTTSGAMGACYNGTLLTCNPLSHTWMSSLQACGTTSGNLPGCYACNSDGFCGATVLGGGLSNQCDNSKNSCTLVGQRCPATTPTNLPGCYACNSDGFCGATVFGGGLSNQCDNNKNSCILVGQRCATATANNFCTGANQEKMSSYYQCVGVYHGTFNESNGQGCCTIGSSWNGTTTTASCPLPKKECAAGQFVHCVGTTWQCASVTDPFFADQVNSDGTACVSGARRCNCGLSQVCDATGTWTTGGGLQCPAPATNGYAYTDNHGNIINNANCGGGGGNGITPTTTKKPNGGDNPTPQCISIVVYKNGSALSAAQLAALHPGDVVTLAYAPPGAATKVHFHVNNTTNTDWNETTTKNANGQFVWDYTLANTATFNITVQWFNGTSWNN